MFVVKIVDTRSHAVKKPVMREATGTVKVLTVAGDGIRVGKHFRHTAKLLVKHSFHLLIG